MFFYTYRIDSTSGSGNFYIGSHSSKTLNDKYLGSGNWIKSIKDRNKQKTQRDYAQKRVNGDFDCSLEEREIRRNRQINSPKMECPHCGKVCSEANAKGYHFDKCKKN